MKNRIGIIILAPLALCGQALDLSRLEALRAKARESQVVTLDGEKLKFASAALSSSDPQQAKAKTVVAGLKGVFVRTFEFDKPGEYSTADLDAVRVQLKGAAWSKIADVREKDESTEVYFHMTAGKMTGLAVITAEPKELTVVNIVGEISPENLGAIGSFGKLGDLQKLTPVTPTPKPTPSPAPKKQED